MGLDRRENAASRDVKVKHGNGCSQYCVNTLPSSEAYCALSRKIAQDNDPSSRRYSAKLAELLAILNLIKIRDDDARVKAVRPKRGLGRAPVADEFGAEPRMIELLCQLRPLSSARIDHQRARIVFGERRVHDSATSAGSMAATDAVHTDFRVGVSPRCGADHLTAPGGKPRFMQSFCL